MRNGSLLLLTMVVVVSALPVHAQVLDARKVFSEEEANAFLAERSGLQGLAAGQTPAIGVKSTFLLLPTVPVTFNSLEKDETDTWRLGASITSGIGFTLLLGQAALQGETVHVSPWLFAGAALNAGYKEGTEGEVVTQIAGSVFIGTGDVAVTIARGFIDGETTFGIALKVDALTNLAPDAFMCFAGCRSDTVIRETR